MTTTQKAGAIGGAALMAVAVLLLPGDPDQHFTISCGFTWVIPSTNRVVAIEFRDMATGLRIAPYYFHDREIYGNEIAIDPGTEAGGRYVKVHPTTRTQ